MGGGRRTLSPWSNRRGWRGTCCRLCVRTSGEEMTRKRKGGAGSAGDGAEPTANGVDWREALYGGKRSALRRIAFTPATRHPSYSLGMQNSAAPARAARAG